MKRFALIAGFATFSAFFAACATQPKPVEEPTDPGLFLARNAAIAEMMRNFQRVQFEFDSWTITAESRDALAANAEIMSRFEELEVEVQGHCDEVGATDYNLALGDRRAQSIQKYLVTAGVAPSRVSTISFGEERPLTYDRDTTALAKNRRAEFRVTVMAEVDVRSSTEPEPIVLRFDEGPSLASR